MVAQFVFLLLESDFPRNFSRNESQNSLRKHPFLLALRRLGRFARNVPIGEERGETDVFAGLSQNCQCYYKKQIYNNFSWSVLSSTIETWVLNILTSYLWSIRVQTIKNCCGKLKNWRYRKMEILTTFSVYNWARNRRLPTLNSIDNNTDLRLSRKKCNAGLLVHFGKRT